MKKIIFPALLMLATVAGCAQTAVEKNTNQFETAMVNNLKQLDTAATASTLISLANAFERIGKAEKTRWEPFYYAAYCYTIMAFTTPDNTSIDALADKAEELLLKADNIDNKNSEISCMFAMINSCRILVDPVSRFQTKGPEVNALLAKAKEENPDNPRIYLLQARVEMRTPEAFGGGKAVAKKSAETAVKKFETFQVKNVILPNWGASQAKELLERIDAL